MSAEDDGVPILSGLNPSETGIPSVVAGISVLLVGGFDGVSLVGLVASASAGDELVGELGDVGLTTGGGGTGAGW